MQSPVPRTPMTALGVEILVLLEARTDSALPCSSVNALLIMPGAAVVSGRVIIELLLKMKASF